MMLRLSVVMNVSETLSEDYVRHGIDPRDFSYRPGKPPL